MRRTSPGLWPNDVLAARMRDDLKFQKFHPGVESDQGVVACSAYGISAEVGAEVLRMGGNAMDAGLATALTQIPFACGDYVSFAGVFSGVYYDAREDRVQAIEAFWNLPRGETDCKSIPSMNEVGNGRTALVPGFMAAVDACRRQFGTMPLADLLEPAIFFAEEGFELGKMGKIIQSKQEVLRRLPETRELFLRPDGEIYGPADWFRQPKLAGTLRQLAAQGVDYMYRGEWARHFVETVQAAGGKFTLEDLADYEPSITEPLRVGVFGLQACVVPGSTYGSGAVLAALKALEMGGAARLGRISDSASALVRMSQALAYTGEFSMGLFVPSEDRERRAKQLFGERFDSNVMLSEENIRLYWNAVDAGRFVPSCLAAPRAPTHSDCVCVIDRIGDMFTLTHSANQIYFGNTGLSVDGIMLTDSGVYLPQAASLTKPGARLSPVVAPSILYCKEKPTHQPGKHYEPVFATGSIGMGLVNKSICHAYNVLALGMDAIEAQHSGSIMAPDVSSMMTGASPDPSIFIDESQFKPEVVEEARKLGLSLKDHSQCPVQLDVNGGPFLEGFIVAVQRKDDRNLAVGVNWMNSKAVAE